jgi:hypothetical protein
LAWSSPPSSPKLSKQRRRKQTKGGSNNDNVSINRCSSNRGLLSIKVLSKDVVGIKVLSKDMVDIKGLLRKVLGADAGQFREDIKVDTEYY